MVFNIVFTKLKIRDFVALLFFILLGGLFIGHGHASALVPCAITGGTVEDYAGLVVETGYYNDSGTLVGASGSMSVTVTTNTPSSTVDSKGNSVNVVDATSAQIKQYNDTVTFREHAETYGVITDIHNGAYCPPDTNTAVILRGDGTAGSSASTSIGTLSDWVLDCDYSKHPGSYQSFTVTPNGTPSGARAGGTWQIQRWNGSKWINTNQVAPVNGESALMRVLYTQPANTATSLKVFPANFTCTSDGSVYGVAWDPDDSSVYLSVNVTVKGQSSPSSTLTANQQETGLDSTHKHAFNFYPANSPFNQAKLSSVTYTFTTTGVDSAGNSYGTVSVDATVNGATCDNAPTVNLKANLSTCSSDGDIEGVVWDSDDFNQYFDSSAANKMITVTRDDGVSANLSATAPETAPPGTLGHTHGFDFAPSSMPGYSRYVTHTYTFKATGAVNSAGASSALSYTAPGVTMTAPICTTASCSITTNPTIPEPNTSFTFSAQLSYSGGNPPAGGTASVNIPGIGSASTTTSGGSSDTINGSSTGNSPNDYAATWSLSNPAKSGGGCGVTIMAKPYFKVFGSDIVAGGDTDCTGGTLTSGGVLGGWYNNGSPLSSGSGASAQFGVTALGQIIGVGSAQNSGAGASTGLTFANSGGGVTVDTTTTNNPNPVLGGTFGASHCIYNPTSDLNTPTASPTSSTVTVGGVGPDDPSDGVYNFPSTPPVSLLNLNGGNVGNGKNIIVHAYGDVWIKSSIVYSGSGGWTAASQIPSFLLITAGNIYIDPSVTNLDGIYESTGGTIYTCADDTWDAAPGDSKPRPVASANIFSHCNKQLVVHGAFAAKQVNLMRALGSLKDSSSAESDGPTTTCSNSGGATTFGCAGEIFDFSPETYLGGWRVKQSGVGRIQYDAISALPPVL